MLFSSTVVAVIESARAPIHVTRWQGELSRTALLVYLDRVERILAAGPALFVIDWRDVAALQGPLRQAFPSGLAAIFERRGARLLGIVHVVPAGPLRLIETLYWQTPPPCPYTFASDELGALAWARQQLAP